MEKRRKARFAASLALGLLTINAWATQEHPAHGIVLQVDNVHRQLVVSCEAIPGYMDPMEMSFSVRSTQSLANLKPGKTVHFVIVENGKKLYAENIQEGTGANFEAEPMEAGGLTALNSALNPTDASKILSIGQHVPDFALTDQAGKDIRLSQFQGKVVALTFGYSRCPNPNYCYRLSNNLARIAKRFHADGGHDLVLFTIVIDPTHDQGASLVDYANTWSADPEVWHFLTGPLPEIKQVAQMFGMNFWYTEGLLTHSLHTVVIDRKGQLAANLEGNQFTPQQLGDLVQTVMNRP
jgi:protein SCO1